MIALHIVKGFGVLLVGLLVVIALIGLVGIAYALLPELRPIVRRGFGKLHGKAAKVARA